MAFSMSLRPMSLTKLKLNRNSPRSLLPAFCCPAFSNAFDPGNAISQQKIPKDI